jgi:KipI family sensor histidine kinase inhibitor
VTFDVSVLAEQVIRCTVADIEAAQRLANAVRSAALPGVVNVVPTWRCVVITLSSDADGEGVAQLIRKLRADGDVAASPRRHDLPIRYDGDDLERVAHHAGLTVAEVVRRHSEGEYVVAFLGFAPGFGYLSGLDPALATPRLATPRRQVNAGAVGIAADVTGIYPAALPGGWNIVGHVDATLFDPGADQPALLTPGDTVRFAPVTTARFVTQ